MATTKARNKDLITVVRADHTQIKRLFTLVENAQGPAKTKDAFERLVRKLVMHETAEQEVVHPLARSSGNGDADKLVKERLDEEAAGETLLRDLERMEVTDPHFKEELAKLKKEVLEHAEAEEKDEHPFIREHADKEELVDRAETFRLAEKAAPTHPHPRGPQSAVGNILVGPVVAVVDRVRDAIRSHPLTGSPRTQSPGELARVWRR